MTQLLNIRHLYNPIQPSVNYNTDNVLYHEFLPDLRLQNFVYCYWQLKTTQPLSNPFVYKVVADACIDVFFDLKNFHESAVMGFCKKYVEFSLDNTFHYVGIRFLPAMFPVLFNIKASELTNRSERLDLIIPHMAAFTLSRLTDESNFQEISTIFNNYFVLYLSKNNLHCDNRINTVIKHIVDNFNSVQIEQDLNKEISSRQLRRLFDVYIGDTPKIFSQVVRFQHILKSTPSTKFHRRNKPFLDAGYYDQAHFIKEFKQFYGLTPTQAFQK